MVSKFGFFRIPITLEKVFDTTLEFWRSKNGKIIEEGNSVDTSIKILKIQRGMSLSSNGEKYMMKFKFNEYEATTYVAIEVSLSFGYGMQWLTPQKLIKKWGRQFDSYSSFNLVRNGDLNKFFEFKKPSSVPITIKSTEPEVILNAIPQKLFKEEISYTPPKYTVEEPTIPITPKVKLNFCTNCGAAVSENHRFCVNCGHKLRE
jgi:hypothetical protein